MDSQRDPRREQIAKRWSQRLDAAGLGGLWDAVQEGLKPLAPLAAQLIWFVQPGLALFGHSGAAGDLAALLNGDLDSPRTSSEPDKDSE